MLSSAELIIVYGPPDTEPRYTLYPTAPDEALQLRSTVCCVAVVPVPVIVCTVGEFEALLEKDKDAEVAPLADGLKVTVKVAD